jgi:chromosome segregation ATPase
MSDDGTVPDEEFIQKAMEVTPDEMKESYKSDQEWFEDASNAIRQARKFQYLVHRQENVFLKKNIDKNQLIIDEKQREVTELKDQLKGIQDKITSSKKVEKQIKNDIENKEKESKKKMQKLIQIANKLQKDTEENKKDYTKKFDELEARLDKVRYHKHI